MSRALRCAIYTRKSSEEGLDQAFNSLDAQQEACAAYIESQRHEGWTLLPTRYDDGGFSGGNLERPAMQRLLADIAEGKLDLIVVYKVDRLTRSLSDFAKLVEQLDAKNVSFVSVTQAFNTTTSMGRLTLNVLLSFAQFEREVTGERIRDKIAASKKKGMWMGGMVPLGYDVVGRKLVVNEGEAAQIRTIYRRYLELGGVAKLADVLKAEGFLTRVRTAKGGTTYGGCSPSNGALFKILTNPIYRGEVRHRDTRYPGQHEAIVPEDLWNAAQVLREKTRRAVSTLPKAHNKHPLLGLLTDKEGRKYKAVHTTKGHRRYRYYVAKAADDGTPRNRYPADELERHVAGCIETFLANTQKVLDALAEPTDDAHSTELAFANLEAVKKEGAYTQASASWRGILHGVRIESRAVQIRIDRGRLRVRLGFPDSAAGPETTIDLQQPLRLHRTTHELRLVIPSDGTPEEAAKRDESLVRFIARGRHWYRQITDGEMPSIQVIAKAEGFTERYVARVLRGSLLAPPLMEKILAGQQPLTLSGRCLLEPPPVKWKKQLHRFQSTEE
jgi:DNA invertase Pin-like site-specific DNA recombinase